MTRPKITITPDAFVDMVLAIDLCPVEISGLGTVEVHPGERRITDIILFPQECSGGGTEFDRYDPQSFRRYWSRLIQEGRAEETNNQHFWWHSHVDGEAYFSDIDHWNIEEFGSAAADGEEFNPWYISIVGNKRRDFRVRLDVFHPTRETHSDLPLGLLETERLRELYQSRQEHMQKLINQYVRILPSLRLRSASEKGEPGGKNE